MRASRYSHLDDRALLRTFDELLARTRGDTAELLACMAEVDTRRLYAPMGYPSMHAFCVERLHMSEDMAFLRIRAARTARRFPALRAAVAEGRLHLTAVALLAPHLTSGNVGELLELATHRTKAGIQELLARRFPRPDLPARLEPVAGPAPAGQLVPERVEAGVFGTGAVSGEQLVPERVGQPTPRKGVAPVAPERYALQVTISRETHELMRYAQDLAGHEASSGDLAELLNRAFAAYVAQLEKRKFAATDRPRPRRRRSIPAPRHIPAHVKREVWKRDGGRCTFVGENGHRCNARRFLEFDHVQAVARGGEASVSGIRLRCRAHNQLEAERAFGAEFMTAKREAAQRAASARRADRNSSGSLGNAGHRPFPVGAGSALPGSVAVERSDDVMDCLRTLGIRAGEARRAIELGQGTPGATLEDRVRAALRFLGPKGRVDDRSGAHLKVPA